MARNLHKHYMNTYLKVDDGFVELVGIPSQKKHFISVFRLEGEPLGNLLTREEGATRQLCANLLHKTHVYRNMICM